MEYYEYVDVVKLIRLHNKYLYDKQYKLDNKHKFNEYATKYYKKSVSTEDGLKKYNLIKKSERLNRKLKKYLDNNI